MSNSVQIKVPDIGDFDQVEVIEVLVSAGDSIEAEQGLITVESDKASMEIPSPEKGVIKSLNVKVGDKIKQDSVILELEPGQDVADDSASSDADASGSSDAAAASATAGQDQPAKQAADAAPSKDDASEKDLASEKADAPANDETPIENKGISESGGSATVVVPDIGDATDVDVIEIMVQVGDTVAVDQGLITVESDKASMEVPSSHAGVVSAIKVKIGDKVSEGSDILELATTDADAAPEQSADATPKPASEPAAAQSDAEPAHAPTTEATKPTDAQGGAMAPSLPERQSPTAAYADSELPARDLPHASPSVRKFARELGVNLSLVKGSGNKNRITPDDVRQFVKTSLASGAPAAGAQGGLAVLDWPKVDFAKFGPVQAKPLSRIKKIAGANLHRNWVMIPHVTNNDVADITELEALRLALNKENQKSGSDAKITMLAFIIKAVVAALKKFPEFNASLDGDELIFKQYYHIGFAADTPNGLVVPVIRDVDKKGIADIAAETAELARLARDGKLSPGQMQGGCFSISSLGGIGGTNFTPIINAPEVAILGVSRSTHAPVWDGSEFKPRLMLPLSLSYDHRVIDGASAARFNAYVGSLLADMRRIVL